MAVHTPAYKVDGGGPASIQVVTWRSVNMFNTNFNSSDNLIELRSGCNISVVVGDLAGTWSDGSVDFAIAVKDFAKTASTGRTRPKANTRVSRTNGSIHRVSTCRVTANSIKIR